MPVFEDDDRPRPRRKPEPKAVSPLLYLAVAFLGLLVIAGGIWIGSLAVDVFRGQPAATNPDAKPKETVANGPLDAEETEANQVFEADKASVVNVDTVLTHADRSKAVSSKRAPGPASCGMRTVALSPIST